MDAMCIYMYHGLIIQQCSGAQTFCLVGQMGRARSICGPDPASAPYLASRAVMVGPHSYVQVGRGQPQPGSVGARELDAAPTQPHRVEGREEIKAWLSPNPTMGGKWAWPDPWRAVRGREEDLGPAFIQLQEGRRAWPSSNPPCRVWGLGNLAAGAGGSINCCCSPLPDFPPPEELRGPDAMVLWATFGHGPEVEHPCSRPNNQISNVTVGNFSKDLISRDYAVKSFRHMRSTFV